MEILRPQALEHSNNRLRKDDGMDFKLKTVDEKPILGKEDGTLSAHIVLYESKDKILLTLGFYLPEETVKQHELSEGAEAEEGWYIGYLKDADSEKINLVPMDKNKIVGWME